MKRIRDWRRSPRDYLSASCANHGLHGAMSHAGPDSIAHASASREADVPRAEPEQAELRPARRQGVQRTAVVPAPAPPGRFLPGAR